MEKPAQLGARLNNLFQVMEKLHARATKKLTPEDLHQLRYTSSKILNLVTAQEKFNRDLILKHGNHLDQLMSVLETLTDPTVLLNILHLLVELVGKAQTGKRASPLVNHGATNILFQVLVREWKEPCPNEEVLLSIHQLLSKIGRKDRKFGLKARLNQAMPVTMGMLKNNCSNFRVLNYLLNVLKLYSSNGVNASYLGKQNVIPYLFKTMSTSGKKHPAVLKLAVDTLVNLTKSKSNSARTIGQDGVRILLSMHFDWHQFDVKHRHITLRKSILNVLKNITNLKSGRKSFVEVDGIKILYESCQEAGDHREMESLILTASLIMRKCCPKNTLPLDDIKSHINYTLPVSDYYIPDTCHTCLSNTGDKLTAFAVNEAGACAMAAYACREPRDNDSDHSSVDEDDDIDSDDDRFKNENSDGEEDTVDTDSDPLYRRSAEELRMYDRFFPELNEFQECLQYSSLQPADSAIVIPTAPSDGDLEPRQAVRGFRLLHRDSLQPSKHNHSRGSNSSGSSIRSTTPTSMTSETDSFPECSVTSSERYIQGSSYNRYTTEGGLWTPETSPGCASAINLKTGSSVISFDLSSNKAQLAKNAGQKRQQKGVKGTKKSAVVKDKKGKKSQSDPSWYSGPDFLDALSITPLSSPRETPNTEDIVCDMGREGGSDVCSTLNDPEVYSELAEQTGSASQFDKLAYPDLHGCQPVPFKEPLYHRKFGVQRQKIFEDIDRMIHPDQLIDRVVYDVDKSLKGMECTDTDDTSWLTNDDEQRIGIPETGDSVLHFNSAFECGNLRKAIQVRDFEYDLILEPDVNTNHHHQWFYFEVSNMIAGVPYRFNIINCEKLNSQFNFGMKPAVYSVTMAKNGQPYWIRKGTEICYYRNHFLRSSAATGGLKGKSYFTTTFSLTFQYDRDICYVSYHYPYTFTSLQVHMANWESRYDSNRIFFRRQTLCESIGGNEVAVLTITSLPHSMDREGIEEFRQRPYIFLSSRVHPGESNSSWVMKGTIDFLLSDRPSAKMARDMFIFKIVPMLNPDGVINGCHRCSLTAEDLNRRWLFPCPKLHPTIYHTKGLLLFLSMINRTPLVFCDYHGHSRRKNVFLYGCSAKMSWVPEDRNNPACNGNRTEDNAYKALPRYLHSIAPAFSFSNCCFLVEKAKESTARVVVWRQIGVLRSYTMESTYCGCDQGLYKDQHMTTFQLEEMGRKFCEGLIRLSRTQPATDATAHIDQSGFNNMSVGSRVMGRNFDDEKSNETALPAEAFSEDEVDSDIDDSDDSDDDEEGTPDDIDDESLF